MSSTEEYQQKQFYAPEGKVATTAEAKKRHKLIIGNFGHIPLTSIAERVNKLLEEVDKNFKRKQQ